MTVADPPTPERIGGLSAAAVRQHRRMYVGSLVLAVAALAVSLVFALRAVDQEQRELARAVAETYVAETVALRSWVSAQGGVFAPESESVPPNPHLPSATRTRVTSDGERLTLLNPAYLTRIVGEETERVAGTRIRLTANAPLRAENAPDAWEADALARLSGHEPVWGLVQSDGGEVFRYLAPLEAEPSCLRSCHSESEVQAGGVLGAITVGYDFAPFREAIQRQRRLATAGHLALLLLAVGLLTGLSRALRGSLVRLARAGERIADLERLLPICATCKRVRVDGENGAQAPTPRWVQIEDYVHLSVDAATFSHGVCPHCVGELEESASG